MHEASEVCIDSFPAVVPITTTAPPRMVRLARTAKAAFITTAALPILAPLPTIYDKCMNLGLDGERRMT